jgi:signal transduction histidine kinase
VVVRAKQDGGHIQVTIEDEGIGIPAADRERIFERFVQGETGDRRRFGGIGLGLYIVRQLAREQGGEVVAEEREGGGTIMRLELRLAEEADEADEQPQAAAPTGPAGKAGPVGKAGPAGEAQPGQVQLKAVQD